MSLGHPAVLLFGVVVFGLVLIGIAGAVLTALETRKGSRTPLNRDDAFWKQNGDTWLGP